MQDAELEISTIYKKIQPKSRCGFSMSVLDLGEVEVTSWKCVSV